MRPRGMRPALILTLYAALKRRSFTVPHITFTAPSHVLLGLGTNQGQRRRTGVSDPHVPLRATKIKIYS
jgi:hypothetical protein